MRHLQNIKDTAIIKSIEYEVRNYRYWDDRHKQLNIRQEELNNKMYTINAVSYDPPLSISDNDKRGHILIEWIDEKQELYKQLDRIKIKKDFVDSLLKEMDAKDRDFIFKVLVERRFYETNDTLAMRLGLTESGIRFKVDVILRKAFKRLLSKED